MSNSAFGLWTTRCLSFVPWEITKDKHGFDYEMQQERHRTMMSAIRISPMDQAKLASEKLIRR